MSTMTLTKAHICNECGSATNEAGVCLNVDCTEAQKSATRVASQATRKATAGAYEPRAFSRAGRVD